MSTGTKFPQANFDFVFLPLRGGLLEQNNAFFEECLCIIQEKAIT